MQNKFIKIERHDYIAVLRFDNYNSRNALSKALILELLTAFSDLSQEDVRALVLRSDKKHAVWSAGHDINELPQVGCDPMPADEPLVQLLSAIQNFRAPVIAMIDGSIWGGACDLVMSCDIVLGDEDSTFAITPSKLGLPYSTSGILRFISRLPLNIVKEMFFTAAPINAQRAVEVGLLNTLWPAAKLESEAYAMAKLIATRSPQAITAFKAQTKILSDAIALSPTEFERIQMLRRNVYLSDHYDEGIAAFKERRSAVFGACTLKL